MKKSQTEMELSTRLEAKRADVLDVILKSSLIDRFGFRMSLWSGLYAGPVFMELERRLGITRDENNILFSLTVFGSTTAKVISDYLGRPKNSLSRAVESLLKKGHISSKPDPSDRRRVVLSINKSGRDIYLSSSEIWKSRQDMALAHLSEVETVALDAILTKMLLFDGWDAPLASNIDDGSR